MSHNSASVNQYTRFSQNAYENEQTNNKCFHFYTVYWSPHFNKEIISLFCIFNHIIGSISIWFIYNEMNNSIIQMVFIFTKCKVLDIRYQCVGRCLLFSISTHDLGCFVAGLVLWQHAPLFDLLNHLHMFHNHVLQTHHNHVHPLHANLPPPPIPDMLTGFSWKGCTGTVLRRSCFFLTWLRKCIFTLKIQKIYSKNIFKKYFKFIVFCCFICCTCVLSSAISCTLN